MASSNINSSHSWHALHPFTKFTDQQSHASALSILPHAAIQVVYVNTFHGMFVVCQILTAMVEACKKIN